MRIKGKLNYWTRAGYGYVTPDGGTADLICRMPEFIGVKEEPPSGTPVEYEVGIDGRTAAPEAKRIKVLG